MQEKAIIVGLTVALLSSASYALDPIGPPKALLGQGHWSIGLEHAYSQTDLEVTDGDGGSSQLQENRAYANLRYGVRKNVDAFLRLGVAMIDVPGVQEGDADRAWGLGVATTLRDRDKIDWGLVIQFSRGQSSQHTTSPMFLDESDIEAWSLQVAAGPTYQLRENVDAYGGLFCDILRGDFEDSANQWDFEEDDPFGAFAGLDWAVKENIHWTMEFQYAGSTLAIATGLRWTFD
jgi:opacity protein-like surface antigen